MLRLKILSDPERKCKSELAKSVNTQRDGEETSNIGQLREEKKESPKYENKNSSYLDQLIEDLFHRLFGPSLIGETFIDQEINEFLTEFFDQIQREREFK